MSSELNRPRGVRSVACSANGSPVWSRRNVLMGAWTCTSMSPLAVHAQLSGLSAKRSLTEMLAAVVPAGLAAHLSRVRLTAPELADNGLLVPIEVAVDSPMTPDDHVVRLHLLSQRNPVLRMISLELGPLAAWPGLGTRVRLAGTQTLIAVAEMSQGRFHYGQAEVIVTESACVDGTS